jgi:RNA methyltransferase, TrmH family
MLSKNQVKHITSLQQKKFRELNNEFRVEGEKSVAEVLRSNYAVKAVFATRDWLIQNDILINRHKATIQEITPQELSRISQLTTPNKVLAIVTIPEEKDGDESIFDDIVLVLDNIRDPGNLGTIIRTADWFGIHNIICSIGCVDAYNPKVVQATMGSVFRTNLFYLNLKEFLQSAPANIMTYGCLLEGSNIHTTHLQSPAIIVIGNESNGISEELLPLISLPIKIPFFPSKSSIGSDSHAESLNASHANAIVCYEFRRQQSLLQL